MKTCLRVQDRSKWGKVVNLVGSVTGKDKKSFESSFEETDSEGKADNARKLKEASMNVVVRFEGADGVKRVDPLKLTKIIRTQVGEVKYARVLRD